MIISHRHKFIFLHCRKVAGSSVTALLNRFLGPEDLQLGAWTESIKSGGTYNRKALRILAFNSEARSHFISSIAKPILAGRKPQLHGAVNAALKQPYFESLSKNPPHATAELVRAFAPEAWRDYHKFCFVRNPYEHAVSDYFWRKCPSKNVSFVEYLERKKDSHRPDPERVIAAPVTNWPIYTIKDEVAVDFVGRYELLMSDLEKVFLKIGLDPKDAQLPRAKSETRKKSFGEMYDAKTRSLVEEIYEAELSEFGYEFPS